MPLTDMALRALKPSEKTRKVTDGKGLYIEVSPAGGKWWRLKYYFGGKEKRLSLGVYPEISLKDARDRRDDARRLVAKGIDPSTDRKEKRRSAAVAASDSFESVALEWFKKNESLWAESHSDIIIRRLNRDIFPYMGKRPISEITAPELLEVVRRIEGRALETSHRALQNCGQIFRYGIATGRCMRDLSQDLRGALAPIRSTNLASTTDPKKLGQILRLIDGYSGGAVVFSALRLAPLVFVRPGELRAAEWSEMDLDAGLWEIPKEKMKMKHPLIVPLSRQSLSILREIHPLTGHAQYVFPSQKTSLRPMSENGVLAALRTLGIGKDEMCGHGFRASARTLLDEVLKYRPDIIEMQLAHVVKDPNGRAYNRTTHLPERQKMMQEWADYLDSLKAI